MTSEKKIQPKFEISWLSDNIIYCSYNDNVLINVTDIKDMIEIQEELGVDDKVKRIVHAGQFTSITSEARNYIQKNKPKVKAEAFILTGLSQRILFNFYYKVRKNANPLKSFRNLNNAKKWIESI